MNYFYWATFAALVWGFVPLLEKLGLNKTEPLVGLFYRCIGVLIGLIMLLAFMIKPAQIKTVDIKTALLFVSAGFFASFLGQIFVYNALKVGDVSKVIPISGSYPFLTFLIGILVLGESFTWVRMLGVSLVVAGIWVLKIG
jgi:transporter family protein